MSKEDVTIRDGLEFTEYNSRLENNKTDLEDAKQYNETVKAYIIKLINDENYIIKDVHFDSTRDFNQRKMVNIELKKIAGKGARWP